MKSNLFPAKKKFSAILRGRWTRRAIQAALAAECLMMLSYFAVAAQQRHSAELMADTARNFISSLTGEQRAKAALKFEDEARLDWAYIPKPNRKGLPFRDMTAGQAQLAHALIAAGLSQSGYAKAVSIMSLEQLVYEKEQAAGGGPMLALRNPALYFVTIFGDPSVDGDWGWSVEGHHVSLNFTMAKGKVGVTTPMFYGAEPHLVENGPRAGLRVLAHEEDGARALLASLSAEQRAKAILSAEAPSDVVTRMQKEASIEGAPQGLVSKDMNEKQRALVQAIVDEYISNLPDDLAADRRARAEKSDASKIYFAWMGDTEPGVGHPHYYRIQAETFLIEYDNIQANANHSHTVWRDYKGDFGRDVLSQHQASDHDGARAAGE